MTERWRPLALVAIFVLAVGGWVAEKNANLTRIGVVSREGTVNLTGAVASAEQRARAETLTKGVSGVSRVVNALEVR